MVGASFSNTVKKNGKPRNRMFHYQKLMNLKPKGKPYRYSGDGGNGGLYVYVSPASKRYPQGVKSWRWNYQFGGKRKTLTIGRFPETSISQAVNLLLQAKTLQKQGIDPSVARKQEKEQYQIAEQKAAQTFRVIALQWFEKQKSRGLTEKVLAKKTRYLKVLCSHIGNEPVSELTTQQLLAVLRPLEKEHAYKTREITGLLASIFDYAVSAGVCASNPAARLSKVLLTPPKAVHHPALLKPEEIGRLLLDIDEYPGTMSVKGVLRLLPYVALRSQEIRGARWDEIDFEKAIWTVSAERMKVKRGQCHLVPLSRQALSILREMEEYRCGDLVFPSPTSRTGSERPLTAESLELALKKMGYGRQMSVHGFRRIFSTCLNECGFRSDVIEKQLAHEEQNGVRRAYNAAEYLDERKDMLQRWADFLDDCREKARKNKQQEQLKNLELLTKQARQQLEKENEQ